MPQRILVAPSAFKGTLGAVEAASAIAEGVRDALDGAKVELCPLADGGAGSMELMVRAAGGEKRPLKVTGPAGETVTAELGWLPTEIAVVEMAQASGLTLVDDPSSLVMTATSRGVGEMISAALDSDPRRIIVTCGDTATSDGGAGLIGALGVGLFDSGGGPVAPGAEGLKDLSRIDTTFRDERVALVDLIAACDVDNPLLGPEGSARVFGPQKGATPGQVDQIEAAHIRLAERLMHDCGKWVGETPYTGAAGGAPAVLRALLGAELRSGAEVVFEEIGLQEKIAGSDLVLVGEGSLDAQSLRGKASVVAARLADRLGAECWAVCGRVELDEEALSAEGITRVITVDGRGSEAMERAVSDAVRGRA